MSTHGAVVVIEAPVTFAVLSESVDADSTVSDSGANVENIFDKSFIRVVHFDVGDKVVSLRIKLQRGDSVVARFERCQRFGVKEVFEVERAFYIKA